MADKHHLAFLTGSHAYGTPHAKSDIDLVVAMNTDTAKQLNELLDADDTEYGVMSIQSGRLNLILATSPDIYRVWRDRTISPMVVRGYSICDPRDNSELQVTLCDETRYEASYILVRRENTKERIAFDADLEEFELLLDVVKLLLQKEK